MIKIFISIISILFSSYAFSYYSINYGTPHSNTSLLETPKTIGSNGCVWPPCDDEW